MSTHSLDYIDDLYVQYCQNPESVSDTWRQYFEQFLVASPTGKSPKSTSPGIANTTSPKRQGRTTSEKNRNGLANGSAGSKRPTAVNGGPAPTNTGSRKGSTGDEATDQALWMSRMQDRVNQLVREFRVRGHLRAQLDPLGIHQAEAPELSPQRYGVSDTDLKRKLDTTPDEYFRGNTIDTILGKLENTYCRSIGAQFMHIDNRNIRDWLQLRMESSENRLELSRELQRRIYARLADASIFEEFVRRKFVGAKTFSLEGAETLIPMLDLALEKAGEHGVKEVVMGMAHRGRLNVMANILKKRAMNIFWSFDDPNPEMNRGGGDVRYHLGYSSDWKTARGDNIHISLCFNPSHLEFVNTVAMGRTRCKQDQRSDEARRDVMTVLIHGDAAFAGEGIVQETLNLSQLNGYRVGGTLHVVINNQVGFTTEPEQGRSSTYATDVAKMLQIPIFHVNGEDPEAVAQVVSLAMDFRNEFQRDVVIDLYAFRRWGHNEGDEPRFTQPRMYNEIDHRAGVREQYLNRLKTLGKISDADAEEIQQKRTEKLEREFEASQHEPFVPDTQTLAANWLDYFGGPEPAERTDTTVDPIRLGELVDAATRIPSDFQQHKKLKRLTANRRAMATGEKPFDWATAELAAFATLLDQGHSVRLTGQDCQRGTFSQRHAVLHDTKTGDKFLPLSELTSEQASIEIHNSPLSEAGVLGFEYGYSLDAPNDLVLWEAQFGDFWNCAQVIVDQFIASAEDKWNRLSGLVMLLPHGFEGQGPEHCSARIERFLAMAAEHNIQVCQPTTPTQYFHLLRRQVIRKWRKPLVVLTPKSLLRHPEVVSERKELAAGHFERVLADPIIEAAKSRRVLLCTGKIYYDLKKKREELQRDDVSIVRIEQLYPLQAEELLSALESVPREAEVMFVQDEPLNMGAWPYVKLNFGDHFVSAGWNLRPVTRAESASPSTGSMAAHLMEQRELIEAAFARL
ncbi:MAG: 2-oxoglutarate dehydrogenase E1 component [Planctomycetota bacterium]